MRLAFDPVAAPRRAADIRRRLREPANAVADTEITMRNGRAVRVEPQPPEPPEPPPPEPVVDLSLHRLIREAQALAGAEPVNLGHPPVSLIIEVVAAYYEVSVAAILSPARTRDIVWPRQVAMWLAKRITTRSLPDIGRRFGGRDHTTVMHAIRQTDARMAESERLRDEIQLLTMRIIEHGYRPKE